MYSARVWIFFFNSKHIKLFLWIDHMKPTSSTLQEGLQNFVYGASSISDSHVIFVEVDHYQMHKIQAADRALD